MARATVRDFTPSVLPLDRLLIGVIYGGPHLGGTATSRPVLARVEHDGERFEQMLAAGQDRMAGADRGDAGTEHYPAPLVMDKTVTLGDEHVG
jgi:hypothetical protein